jgi:leader peptidase (prepilin peptidase)/N-methyltransferase
MSWVVEIDEKIMLVAELFFVILGLIVGSFLNVCIARIPRQESIVFPNSHCPHCRKPIKVYDNIPLLSYLLLFGKCRSCGQRISWQYPVVEVLTALTFWATFVLLGVNLKAVILLIFFSSVVILIFIDLNHRILPDVITLPGVLFGLLFSLLTPVQDSTAEFVLRTFGLETSHAIFISFLNSFLGALICGGFLWLVAEIYFRVRKIEGLGFGDIKLMGMVGAFLGMKLALLTIMLGSMMGAIIGLLFIKLCGKDTRYELPFGSFLGIAAIISALWGHELISNYTQTLYRF